METDIDDILFLIRQNLITFDELERITHKAMLQTRKFDLHPDILNHLQDLRDQLK